MADKTLDGSARFRGYSFESPDQIKTSLLLTVQTFAARLSSIYHLSTLPNLEMHTSRYTYRDNRDATHACLFSEAQRDAGKHTIAHLWPCPSPHSRHDRRRYARDSPRRVCWNARVVFEPRSPHLRSEVFSAEGTVPLHELWKGLWKVFLVF